MNHCPKCSSSNISGPRYRPAQFDVGRPLHEALIYTCERCGYQEETPCDDARPSQKKDEGRG